MTKKIIINETKFTHKRTLYLNKVALIFGKSGSGKTKILETLYSTEEDMYDEWVERERIRWFTTISPQLFKSISNMEIRNIDLKKMLDRETLNIDEINVYLNNEINKVIGNESLGFEIKAEAVKWEGYGTIDGGLRYINISYLKDSIKIPPKSLSDGQKLYAAIIIHILFLGNKNDIWLMDEPFNRLHHSLRRSLLTWLYKQSCFFIIATHNIDLIDQNTILNVNYVEHKNKKAFLHNSFNSIQTLGNSIFDHISFIYSHIGGDDLLDQWSPKNALIVEGVCEFIYLTKNEKLAKAIDDLKLKVIIAGGKDNLINIVDKLIGSSEKIVVLWDHDNDTKWNENFSYEINKRVEFIKNVKVTKYIHIFNTDDVIENKKDIEDLLFNKIIENTNEKGLFAINNYENANAEAVDKLIKVIKSESKTKCIAKKHLIIQMKKIFKKKK